MSKRKKIIIISIFLFILFLLLFSVIFSIINLNNNKILNKVEIEGIDVSNLTIQEATDKIQNWYEKRKQEDIVLKYKEIEENVKIETIITNIDIKNAVTNAYTIGRKGNIIQNNYEIISAFILKRNVKLDVQYNEEELTKKMNEINSKLPGVVIDSSYYIENNNLIIKTGTDGIKIKNVELEKKIKKIIFTESNEIYIPVENEISKKINIEEIYKEIYKEPQDAYISENPIQVHSHINGVDFAISMEEVKEILKEDKEEYVVPLKITIPEKTIDKLGKEAFPSKLSEFSTRYDASNINRSTNLELASEKINGTIIMPGEIFSYNKIVGERTIAKGYKEAKVYAGGKVVDGIGGGICQLSSTLYNAVLNANLEVTSRSNHRFLTSYVDAGKDATVSWGTIDFCFKNTRIYPIKVVSTVKSGIAKVQIYGIEEEKEYEIVIESEVTQIIPYTTNHIEDDTLEEGQQKVEQKGANGAKSITYKIVRYNGILVSKTVISNDTYSPLECIIKKGTKKANEVSENIELSENII